MTGLKVLITNNALAARGGSEMYVRDISLGLQQRGHSPVVYSTQLGAVARELKAAGISVVDNLSQLTEAPDLIHGHHHVETMTALLHFRGVPAINFCHSSTLWAETPLLFPRVLSYVAVDRACFDRLTLEHRISEDRIRVLLNSVDLKRFQARTTPLPIRPQRALVFSNHASEKTYLSPVREACKLKDITLDVIGNGVNAESAQPETLLPNYDLVFAKARCALEALAVGTPVILCDSNGLGPMVTAEGFDQLRPLNFGYRTLSRPLDTARIVREIDRYDRADALEVCRKVRATAGLDSMVDQLVTLYEEVIEKYQTTGEGSLEEEGRAAAAYLRQLKIDFATHGAATLRLVERVQRIPYLGRVGMVLARRITGRSS